MKVQSEIGRERLSLNRSKMLALLVLIVLAGGLYLNTLDNLFTNWDDAMVYSNYSIRSLDWKNLRAIFTYVKGSTYQPVRVLSYAIDYHFWKLNPLGYHITNIFFYILTCLMVFFTLRALSSHLRKDAPSDSHFRTAFFGSLLFAAHPVHVEAVTWLAARKEVLQGFFFFLAFFLYLKAGEENPKRRIIYLGITLFTFLLAVLSKPSAIVFPGVILIYEIARGKGQWIDFIRRHKLFLILAIGISILFTGILIQVMFDAGGVKPYRGGGSFLNNLLVSFYAFVYNIKLLVLNVNYNTFVYNIKLLILNINYNIKLPVLNNNYSAAYTIPLPNPIWSLRTFLFIGIALLLSVVSLWSLKKTRVFFFSFFFFLITIFPFLNLIPISTLLADRYVFIASFSYAFLMGIAFDRLFCYRHSRFSEGFFRLLTVTLFLFLLAGYSFMTLYQNTIWENSYTLWSDAVEKYPDSNPANALMGVVYMELGMDEKAVPYLKKAVQLLPYDYLSRNNLGIVYGRLGESKKGLDELMTAIWLKPEDDSFKINLSVLYLRQGEYQKAIEVLSYLLSKRPDDWTLHDRLARVYTEMGNYPRALSELETSLKLSMSDPYICLEIGNLYISRMGDPEKAKTYLVMALERLPKGSPRVVDLRWMIQDIENHW
jgi:protein O-mannosyl-transferase